MNFPDLPDNHFGPFLAACGGLSEKLSRVIPTIQDSRKRSMLARMLPLSAPETKVSLVTCSETKSPRLIAAAAAWISPDLSSTS